MSGPIERRHYEDEAFWEFFSGASESEKKRVKTVLETIPTDAYSLLDVGCGNGLLTNQFSQKLVVGTDRSITALKFVSTPKSMSEITSLPFANQSFDAVVSTEVLEHLSYQDFPVALQELSRVARKYIIITVPYEERREASFSRCPNCGITFHPSYHIRSFYRSSFEDLFLGTPFKLRSLNGIFPVKRPPKWIDQLFLFYFRITQKNLHLAQSSLCPQCGYKMERKKGLATNIEESQLGKIKKLINQKQAYQWWLAVFDASTTNPTTPKG